MLMSENHHSHSSTKNIAFAFFLNISFAFIELIGGLYTNSIAILSDAIHDFGDSLSLGVSYYLQKISDKKGDEFYSYGYRRFSLLGSVFISLVLVIGSVFIIQEGIKRIIEPQQSNAPGMIILAIVGILVNGIAVLRLKKGTSLNEKAVFLHLMEDVLGWVAVLIAAVVMLFVDVPVLDPILSIAITIWVLFNVYRNLKTTIRIMLQEVPRNININKLKEEINSIDKVVSVHDLHIWSLDGQQNILSLHVVLPENTPMYQMSRIKEQIREVAGRHIIGHVTIEAEYFSESQNCKYKEGC